MCAIAMSLTDGIIIFLLYNKRLTAKVTAIHSPPETISVNKALCDSCLIIRVSTRFYGSNWQYILNVRNLNYWSPSNCWLIIYLSSNNDKKEIWSLVYHFNVTPMLGCQGYGRSTIYLLACWVSLCCEGSCWYFLARWERVPWLGLHVRCLQLQKQLSVPLYGL